MLDVGRLRVLREVVRAGSISGAARALSYTPSAVSQQLAKLERETRTPLLVRSSRGVRPTEAGAALAARAEDILGRLADAEAEVHALSGRPAPLRIGSFPTAAVGGAVDAKRETPGSVTLGLLWTPVRAGSWGPARTRRRRAVRGRSRVRRRSDRAGRQAVRPGHRAGLRRGTG